MPLINHPIRIEQEENITSPRNGAKNAESVENSKKETLSESADAPSATPKPEPQPAMKTEARIPRVFPSLLLFFDL